MKPKKILFVDDEPVVVGLMKTRLAAHGFEVETAMDGLEAIEKAKRWQPDIVLLDIIMPEMDGFEVCRTLKEFPETSLIPVVLFTASQESHLEEKAKKAGAEGVVQKPFIDQVLKTIDELFTGA